VLTVIVFFAWIFLHPFRNLYHVRLYLRSHVQNIGIVSDLTLCTKSLICWISNFKSLFAFKVILWLDGWSLAFFVLKTVLLNALTAVTNTTTNSLTTLNKLIHKLIIEFSSRVQQQLKSGGSVELVRFEF
jgi:hypothetical protein